MALSTYALITVAQAGAHCRLDDATITADTTLLEGYILAATSLVEQYTGRVFMTRTIVETQYAKGGTRLNLRWWPVTDIASITLAGTALDSSAWVERLSQGRVLYSSWTLDAEIVATYTAGYGTDRDVVQAIPEVAAAVMAVKMLVAQMYEDREGISSEAVQGVGSVQKDKEAWKEWVKRLRVRVL